MRKILLIITAVAFATFSFSQEQFERYVVSSAGYYSSNSGYTISSTIGEPIVKTLTSGSNTLTQGFQQGFSNPLKPEIEIYSPMDGAIFTATNSVTVDFNVSDFVVAAGTGDGHIHYYVNGALTMKYDVLAIPLTNLTDGNHVVIMQLVDNAHQSFTPNVADTVSFSVNVIFGCTDTTATNYDATANVDDESCTYSVCNAIPTGLNAYDITDTRFRLGWDNMNTASCIVLKYNVRYREAATSTSSAGNWTTKSAGNWTTKSAGTGNGKCSFGLNNVEKLMINFNPSTTYDLRLRVQYCGSTAWSGWTSTVLVTTADVCPDLANMQVQTFNGQQTKAKFTWDTTGVYMFARLYTRVNGGSAPFDWTVQGGFGIDYPAFHKNIFTFTAGETYRVQGNSFCSATMSSFRGNLTPPVIWTQPGGSSKLQNNGIVINNLNVYPNPSRDMFNISFTSEVKQDLRVRIMNAIGEELINEDLYEFIGEYTKQIDLTKNAKGIYFLEVETNEGIINKKLILQ